jgi:hypothetical protein
MQGAGAAEDELPFEGVGIFIGSRGDTILFNGESESQTECRIIYSVPFKDDNLGVE